MNFIRIASILAVVSVAPSMVEAAEAPAIADQPAGGSSLLDRLFPTTRPTPHRHHVASRLRPHDAASPVVRVAAADAHERPSMGVIRARLVARDAAVQRLAVLDKPVACDSLLCPGYALIGVGF